MLFQITKQVSGKVLFFASESHSTMQLSFELTRNAFLESSTADDPKAVWKCDKN